MKLVRDETEAALKGKNPHVVFDEAPPDQREGLLFSKLLEEACEWLCGRDREQRLKELGDLTEVLWALGEIDGIQPGEIVTQAAMKREARGGFSRLALLKVETGDEPARPEPVHRGDWYRGVGDGPLYSG